MILRFRAVDKKIFEAIKSGKKKVETRAASARYRALAASDTILFVCGSSRFERKIKKVRYFKTPLALLRAVPVRHISPWLNSKEEQIKMWNSFPGYREKIKKFGLVAVEL